MAPNARNRLTEKYPDVGEDQKQEKGATEDEMVGWHHRLEGHELSKLRETVKIREAWCGAVHRGVAKVGHSLATGKQRMRLIEQDNVPGFV